MQIIEGIWKTTHPQTGVVGKLPPSMWNSLWPCLGALLCTAIAFVWIRAGQARLSMALDRAWIDADGGDAPA